MAKVRATLMERGDRGVITVASGERLVTPAKQQTISQNQLHSHLTDPAFTQRDDFPSGTVEAMLQLADPPYYTPCPNPFLREIVRQWQAARRAPVGAHPVGSLPDLPVGAKTDKRYTLHTYHSKLPASTLAHLIEHFCTPGDVVLDCFCGSGVTGVACAEVTARGKPVRAVLVDLSPAATFITYNYLFPVEPAQLEADGNALLAALAPLYSDLYCDERGAFDYTIYADVYTCAACGAAVTFWDGMVDRATMHLQATFRCTHCGTTLPKTNDARQMATWPDPLLQQPITQALQLPVARKYGRHLHQLTPGEQQQALAATLAWGAPLASQSPIPIIPWPDGANCSQPKRSHQISHLHHLFTPRNLTALSHLWQQAGAYTTHRQLRFAITAFMLKTGSRLHNIGFKQGNINLAGQLPNTYYLPNLSAERHIGKLFADKLKALTRFYATLDRPMAASTASEPAIVISTGSATALDLPDNSIDYCLTDPPFGGFVHYGELNFVWEAWLGVMANRAPEAIVYAQDGKDHDVYQELMRRAFAEIYRVLKPGKWLTLVFHNSNNQVWNSIQTALNQVGFVVADVRAATRGQGSYKQMTAAQALQSDLLMSAYKPTARTEQPTRLTEGSVEGVWAFIRTHLQQLPMPTGAEDQPQLVAERQRHLLFDRMVAYHIRQGMTVPLSVGDFYHDLQQHFPQRAGMYFLPEQAVDYDRQVDRDEFRH
ncbi:MAG: DNA methyltransferase [Caldilineaceae bacterium]